MKSNQVARFSIKASLVRENPEELSQIFTLIKAVPVRAELMFDSDTIEYVAISERFNSLKQNEAPPTVELLVTKDSGGRVELVEIFYKWEQK